MEEDFKESVTDSSDQFELMFFTYGIENEGIIHEEYSEDSIRGSKESILVEKPRPASSKPQISKEEPKKLIKKVDTTFTKVSKMEPAARDHLIEEILHLKTQRNEYEETIKKLKNEITNLKLHAGSKNEASLPKVGSTSSKKGKSIEDLLEENQKLKLQIKENEERFKIQIGRMTSVSNALQKKGTKDGKEAVKTKKEDVYELLQHIYSVEFKLSQKLKECNDLAKKIEERDKTIQKLEKRTEVLQAELEGIAEKVNKREKDFLKDVTVKQVTKTQEVNQLLQEIESHKDANKQLWEEIDKLKEDKVVIRKEMDMELQIAEKYPKTNDVLIVCREFLDEVENYEGLPSLERLFKGFAEKCSKFFQRLIGHLTYLFFGRKEYHPDVKDMVKSTLGAWKKNPTMVSKQFYQNADMQNLRGMVETLKEDNETLAYQNMLLNEKLETSEKERESYKKEVENYEKEKKLQNKAMIKDTVKAWNETPSIVRDTIDRQVKEIIQLKERIKEMEMKPKDTKETSQVKNIFKK